MNMSISKIENLIDEGDWKSLLSSFLPATVAATFSFINAMHVVDRLVKASTEMPYQEGATADLMRDYAVNLMIILREKFPNQWQEDWKNEAFLGIMCSFVYRDEEAFKYLKNVYMQLEEPPQSLILAYISAGSRPGLLLTKQEIADLSYKAINNGITYESALQMAYLAHEEGNIKNAEEWEKKAAAAEKNGIHTPIITPNVIKSSFDGKCGDQWGYKYEE